VRRRLEEAQLHPDHGSPVRRADALLSVNGRPELREVRLGWKFGPWTEVAGGLAEGQEIFLDLPASEKERK